MDRLFADETRLKVLSVVLAVALWFGVMSSRNPHQARTLYDVEVVPEGLDAGLAVYSVEPATVAVTLSGPQEFLQDLDAGDARATLDLSGSGAGTATRPVTVVPLRGRVRVLRINPPQVLVRLEPRMEKTVPVELQMNGEPAPDYVIDNPTLSAEQVTVSGVRSLVDRVVKVVATAPVGGIRSTIAHAVTLTPVDRAGRPVESPHPLALVVEPATVQVTIPVVRMPRKEVPVQARLAGEPAPGFEIGNITIDPEAVTVRSRDEGLLEELQWLQTAPIDIAGLDHTVKRDVALALPAGVVTADGRRSVQVTIEVRPAAPAAGNPSGPDGSAGR